MFLSRLAPWLLVAVIGFGLGYSTAIKKLYRYQAQVEAQTEVAAKRAQEIEQTLTESAKIIEVNNAHHRETIDAMAADTRKLLVERVRKPADKCPVSDHTATPGSSDETSAGNWILSEADANRLIDRFKLADEITETARACQNYLNRILTEENKHERQQN